MPFDVIVGRNESDKKAFGKRGLAYIGKSYVTMGNYTSLSNPIYMDVVRPHVVLISGKRGCLTGDTMVFTDKGYKSIETFNESEDKVLSFNKGTKEFEWEKAELLKYPIKNENLFKIVLEDGRIINLTKEHPLLSSYGKYFFYRRACDLKVKDKIVLSTILPEIRKDNESLRIARLLGFILADGTINIRKGRFKDERGKWYNGTKARIRINNACEEVLDLAKKDFEKEFNIIAKRYERNDCNCEIVETKYQKVVNKFVELGVPVGLKSHKIRVPKIVFESSNKFKSEFISALFDCDGFICKKANTIDYSSKSRKFLEDLQILLTHFNIESVIRIKNAKCNGKIFENYRLFITDNSSIENFKQIGFHSNSKQKRLDGHKSNGSKRRKTHYPTEGLVCKKIKSIERLGGVKEVYDLSVNKNHSFIANGVISHNSGKSYTIGVMAEALSSLGVEESGNIAPLIFDTMGIFWTMKYKNEKDRDLLDEWGLKAKNIPMKVFAPFGYYQEYRDKGIEVDAEFAIKISELSPADWVALFELKFIDPIAVIIESVVSTLKESKGSFSFEDIYDLINRAENISQEVKNSAMALFDAAKTWKVFDEEKGTEVRDLISAGETTVIDLSMYASLGAFNVRALIIGLVSKKIFNERMAARKDEEIQAVQHGINYMSYKVVREMPLVWIFIDECLVGDTKISTSKGNISIKDIVEGFESGEKFQVLGFDRGSKTFDNFEVSGVFRKGKREIIKLISETGREIKCTPEHRILTRDGFASAFSISEIAVPLVGTYSKTRDLIEARILGHIFGDGWISDKFKTVGFSGKGNLGDLEKIKQDLSFLGFKSANVFERKTKSKINHKGKITEVNGTSMSFASTSAYKFFRQKAEFSGEKVLKIIKVPDWLMEAGKDVKAEFLAALMGADGQIITSAKNASGDFNAIRFSFNKIESLEREALLYANQIVELFGDLGIKVSSVAKREGNLRKDGNKTMKFIITLEKNTKNIIRFLERVGYRYCSVKELECRKWLSYLSARLFLKKERGVVWKNAMKLKGEGLGKVKISKILNFPEPQIRDWIYNGTKPGLPKSFLDYGAWVKERVVGNLLFESVFRIEESGEEEVYDISVDKVHNFVADGIVTHNCHEFLPREGRTPATDALVQLLREGRQPGISVVMATQQPGKIHTDAMTQSDIILSHRVTAKLDVQALNDITQSYLYESISDKLNGLPRLKGSAIILDDNSERIYPMRVRPRFTWHGGEAPTAIKKVDEEL